MRKIENRVVWCQYPAFTDIPSGPWSNDLPRYDDEPFHHWRRFIDWMAELEVNVFIGSIESYLRGARHSACPDWPFHQVCEWKDFPYAQCMPCSYLTETRKQVNKIIEYFNKKGIRVFLHHYNFFAPDEWLIRQPELLGKREGIRPEEMGSQVLARSVCPNAPIYQRFMEESWKELFHHLPGLSGLLITLGEANLCPCEECTGGTPINTEWRHTIRNEQIHTFSKFVKLYIEVLRRLKKEPMVRCWHEGGDKTFAKEMPKGITYVIKYSGFNSIDCPPDPIYKYWQSEGHNLWVVHELSGNEQGGPCTWINPEWVGRVVGYTNNEMKVTGQIAFHNNFIARLDMTYFSIFINMESALRFFNGEDYNEEYWRRRCKELMGEYGDIYFDAGKLYSQIILNIDKVVSYPIDGLMFTFNYHLTGDPVTSFPGVIGELGQNGTEPHPWTRGNVSVLRRYKEYLDDNTWDEEIFKKATPDTEIEPLDFLKEKWELAKKACQILEGVNINEDDIRITEYRIIYLSAKWAEQFGGFWYNFAKSKVFYWGANSLRTPIEVQRELAKNCISCLDEVVSALFEMRGIYYQFPVQYILWEERSHLHLKMEEKLQHYKKMRDDVKGYFSPLIKDMIFQWPTIYTFKWGE